MKRKNNDSFWKALVIVLAIICFFVGLILIFSKVIDAVAYIASVPERMDNLEDKVLLLEFHLEQQQEEINTLQNETRSAHQATTTLNPPKNNK